MDVDKRLSKITKFAKTKPDWRPIQLKFGEQLNLASYFNEPI